MVNELNEKNFNNVITNNNVLVLDFHAEWCGPCKTLKPEFAKLAESYRGKNIYFGSVDVEENDDIVRKYGVRNLPTILLIKNGEVIDKRVGAISSDRLHQMMDAV